MRALILAEPPESCAARLAEIGYPGDIAAEIAAYLSQATDLETDRAAILGALEDAGFEARIADPSRPVDWVPWLLADPARTIVWSITDGIRYYMGSSVAPFARLCGARVFGSAPQAHALAQNKAKAGSVAQALGAPGPPFGLSRDGAWLTAPPAGEGPWFVKPNTLGAKIGIWADSKVETLDAALALSRRIHARYRDDAIVQAFIPGRDVRVSYMAVQDDPDLMRLGIYRLDTGGGGEAGGNFMTMADNATLSGLADVDGGATLSSAGQGAFQPRLTDLARESPEIAGLIGDIARRLAAGLGLRDLFSMDIRLDENGTPWLLEAEVCPAVTIYDFRRYLDDHWGCTLPEALARTFTRVLQRPEEP